MFFTLPDFSDISLRDYQETMQRPFFSLSKKKRVKPIEYVSPDKQVTVHVSANPEYGMATIWDADIMIYLASHLNELRERGANDLSPTIRLQPGDLLKRICWGVSGRAYERLIGALDRLQATTIKTNIRANSKTRETTFSWIDSYTHLVDERTQRSLGMEITLSKWFFDGVMDKRNVLAISPLYFEITSGLGKCFTERAASTRVETVLKVLRSASKRCIRRVVAKAPSPHSKIRSWSSRAPTPCPRSV
jgi:plasmid replication initiation protein